MRYFPVFFDLQDRKVVVVGGGEEALRKIRLLAKSTAKINVIAAELHPEIAAMARIVWLANHYEAKFLQGAALVLSAEPTVNAMVSADAQALGIPVNAVDEADISTFIVPSIVDRDPVVVAIGTEGTAPVLAQGLRARIDGLLPQNLGTMARRASTLRPWVAEKLSAGAPRRAFWHEFFFGSVAEALKHDDEVAFKLALGDTAFNATHGPRARLTLVASINDPELITLKAQRRLMEADVIFANAGSHPAILEMARRDAVRHSGLNLDAVLASLKANRNVVILSPNVETSLVRVVEAAGFTVEQTSTPLVTSKFLQAAE